LGRNLDGFVGEKRRVMDIARKYAYRWRLKAFKNPCLSSHVGLSSVKVINIQSISTGETLPFISTPKFRPAARKPEFWYDSKTSRFVKFCSTDVNDLVCNVEKYDEKKCIEDLVVDASTPYFGDDVSAQSIVCAEEVEADIRIQTSKIEETLQRHSQLNEIYKSKSCLLKIFLEQISNYSLGLKDQLPSDFDFVKVLDAIKSIQIDLEDYNSKERTRKDDILNLRNSIGALSQVVKTL
jgi:hypothetical protein